MTEFPIIGYALIIVVVLIAFFIGRNAIRDSSQRLLEERERLAKLRTFVRHPDK